MRVKLMIAGAVLAVVVTAAVIVLRPGPPREEYRLEVDSKPAQNTYLGHLTTIRFYQGSRLLWQRDRTSKYFHHHVTPEGRVWLIQQGSERRMIASSIAVVERDGTVSHGFAVGRAMRAPRGTPSIDWAKSTLEHPRGDDTVEVLSVQDVSGKRVRFAMVRTKGKTFALDAVTEAFGPGNGFFDAFLDPSRPLPTKQDELNPSTQVWTSGKDAWVINASSDYPERPSAAVNVRSAHAIAGVPTLLTNAPGHTRVLFLMDRGLLVLYDYQWRQVYSADLRALSGISDPKALAKELRLESLAVSDGIDWFKPEERRISESLNKLELVARDGRHFVWTITGDDESGRNVGFEVLDGLAARHDLEPQVKRENEATERRVDSPNGRYTVRVRTFLLPWNDDGSDVTQWEIALISNERDVNGKRFPIEIWSQIGYSEMSAPRVSDGGLVTWFVIARNEDKEYPDRTFETKSLFLREVDHPAVSHHLTKYASGAEVEYASAAEAKRDTLTDRSSVASSGDNYHINVHGLSLPKRPVEEVTVVRRNGPPIVYKLWNGQVTRQTKT